MIDEINELIDINLKLICETKENEIFSNKFKDINGRELTSKYKGDKFAHEMESRGLIRTDGSLCIVEEFGFKVFKNGGWKKFLTDQIEQENKIEIKKQEKDTLDFEKTKVDLELAQNMLKEYPKTKWFARIGFAIAIILALLEIIQWLMKLP